jgi:hypothetical protein
MSRFYVVLSVFSDIFKEIDSMELSGRYKHIFLEKIILSLASGVYFGYARCAEEKGMSVDEGEVVGILEEFHNRLQSLVKEWREKKH